MKRESYHESYRSKQRSNSPEVHHPEEKIQQIKTFLSGQHDLQILELFAGEGNLTKIYKEFGTVETYDKKLGTGDSFLVFHQLISQKKKYDVVDLDPYGFPNRMFPDIFLLIDDGFLFLTMPKPYVNFMNPMTQTFMESYYGSRNPTLSQIIRKIKSFALCHWRTATVLDRLSLGRLDRLVWKVKRVKANEYCNTRNR